MKMQGNALKNAGIFNGDILVVDRSLPAADRRLIVAELNGELTARRFRSHEGSTFLLGEDGRTPPYRLSRKDRFFGLGRRNFGNPENLTMYLLIDCDNFFRLLRKAFQPRLKNRPVVVLSNNDGCVVSPFI